jgi:hypothetical protein
VTFEKKKANNISPIKANNISSASLDPRHHSDDQRIKWLGYDFSCNNKVLNNHHETTLIS